MVERQTVLLTHRRRDPELAQRRAALAKGAQVIQPARAELVRHGEFAPARNGDESQAPAGALRQRVYVLERGHAEDRVDAVGVGRVEAEFRGAFVQYVRVHVDDGRADAPGQRLPIVQSEAVAVVGHAPSEIQRGGFYPQRSAG